MKNEAIDRMKERKMERMVVQLESKQPIYHVDEINLRDLTFQDD